jgi:hypothetical protein
VVAGDHDHRLLDVQRHDVEPVRLDGEPDQAHVRPAVVQDGGLLVGVDEEGHQRLGAAVAPPAYPLVGGDAGDERDPEGRGGAVQRGSRTTTGSSRSVHDW